MAAEILGHVTCPHCGRANLQRVSGLIRHAQAAPLLQRAALAMDVVDQTAALLAEMVENIEQQARRLAVLEQNKGVE